MTKGLQMLAESWRYNSFWRQSLSDATGYFVIDSSAAGDGHDRLYLCQAVPGEQHHTRRVTASWALLPLPARCQDAAPWVHTGGKIAGMAAGCELHRETCSAFALKSISVQHNRINPNKSVKLLSHDIQTRHDLVKCWQWIHPAERP